MQTLIVKNELKTVEKRLSVSLKPCNEKQEINYFESFTGTPKQIIERSVEIVNGLNSILKNGDFSIKIESFDLTKAIYLDSNNLFDEDFNIVGKIQDFKND